MSRAISPSTQQRYGVVLVTEEFGVARSTYYAQRDSAGRSTPAAPQKRGPKTAFSDAALLAHIRRVLEASPFLGEGHRKVWARLRHVGIRTSKPRVLRVMREAQLLAPSRARRVAVPVTHDGTITTDRPDVMWGTDITTAVTVEDGQVASRCFLRAPVRSRLSCATPCHGRAALLDQRRASGSSQTGPPPGRAGALRGLSRPGGQPARWRRVAPLRRGGVPELSAMRLARGRVRSVSMWLLWHRPSDPLLVQAEDGVRELQWTAHDRTGRPSHRPRLPRCPGAAMGALAAAPAALSPRLEP